MPKLPPETRLQMVEDYLSGIPSTKIAKAYAVTYAAVRKAVLATGNAMRTTSEGRRKFNFNERFFETINTEEKAYWLGFISADGTVIENKGIMLALKISDFNHLVKFKSSLESKHPIKDRGNHFQLFIGSQLIAAQLTALGVTPRKSLTLTYCSSVPQSLLCHYWRGLIDGDGCISSSPQKDRGGRLKWSVSITGSQSIVNEFKLIGMELTSSNPSIHRRGNAYGVMFSGNRNAKIIANYLYGTATIFLDRKYKLVQDLNAC